MKSPRLLRCDCGLVAKIILMICVSLELLFFTLDYHVNYAGGAESSAIRRLFDTALESSLPAWFSIMQTAMVALTLWLVYVVVRATQSRGKRAGWLARALFFSYLAFDDGAHIHERVGTAYHEIYSASAVAGGFGAWTLDLFPSYRWQIVFMPIFAAMGLFMLVFLLRELRGRGPKVGLLVALGCLSTAVGLDFLKGLQPQHALNPYTAIMNTWHLDYWVARTFESSTYSTLLHFSRSIEECIEMFAMTLLWFIFVGHLGRVSKGVSFEFVEGGHGELHADAVPAPETAESVRQAVARSLNNGPSGVVVSPV